MFLRRSTRTLQVLALSLVITAIGLSTSFGQECDGDTCISVSADNENQVVITVKKGKPGSSSTTTPKPRPTPIRTITTRPQPWIPWAPKPTIKPSPKPSTKITPKPKPRKRTQKPRVKRISATELADQVKRSLPSGILITQPSGGAILREPVNFMTTVPSKFQTVIVVLEIPILITLNARYLWDFGDGKSEVSSLPGAPYPASIITHTYREAGEFNVSLKVTWSGTWRAGALSGPINGVLAESFERQLLIFPADTFITR